MKERPILFSSPMVRAILAGTKTQTRRVVKPRRHPYGHMMSPDEVVGEVIGETCSVRSPHGVPGDRLWVREAFMHEPADYCWEASVSIPCRPSVTIYRADIDGDARGAGWTSPIHMPRNLSRLDLEITSVRVEKLNDISEADAIAEGVTLPERTCTMYDGIWRDGYRQLWESINGPGSWDRNPWVWVIEFKRLEPRQ